MNITSSSLNTEEIKFVLELSAKAGAMALAMSNNLVIRQKSGPHDLVTNADQALSDLIISELKHRFPDDIHVSEEDENSYLNLQNHTNSDKRLWFVDPIDGTDSYIAQNGRYSVMIGVLERRKPVFGCVYVPSTKTVYFGGPEYGVKKQVNGNTVECPSLQNNRLLGSPARLIITRRDQKRYPWTMNSPDIKLINGGSIGLKVVRVIEEEADIVAYFSGQIKHWDTVGPSAIALGCGLEVGSLEADNLPFHDNTHYHETSIIIGKPGSLAWARTKFKIEE